MPIRDDKNMLKRRVSQKKSNKTSINTSDPIDQRPPKKNYLDLATLIRSIQRAEGHTGCFKVGMVACEQMECKWRAFCL
jgi:hypothetical protein